MTTLLFNLSMMPSPWEPSRNPAESAAGSATVPEACRPDGAVAASFPEPIMPPVMDTTAPVSYDAGATFPESQAKEPEASGGLCAKAPHAVQVGEASADLPATSEFMDVTAAETAPYPPSGYVLFPQADLDRMLALIAELQVEREADRIDQADYARLLEKERVELLEPLPIFLSCDPVFRNAGHAPFPRNPVRPMLRFDEVG